MKPKSPANKDLPPNMLRRVRERKNQTATYFFYVARDASGRRHEVSLGKDLAEAKVKWAELERRAPPRDARTIGAAMDRYEREVMPTKAPRTQRDNRLEMREIRRAFGHMALEAIKPKHIAQYRDRRSAKIRANRELALLSHVFNMAREWGLTDAENPCRGVKRNKPGVRDFYASDQVWEAVMSCAPQDLRFAMELAHLTGQRPADVLAMRWADVRDGMIDVRQGKTNKRLRIVIEGRLEALLGEIRATIPSRRNQLAPWVLTSSSGNKLTSTMIHSRMKKAREAAASMHPDLAEDIAQVQFRDARPKAASELDLGSAQALLGHANPELTKRVYQRAGQVVKPAK
ncbi:tyrosine-type recombinase/integrase [Comamonadaceae bacterium M7527]|nr:tyrosine-type recombinase/integrase [Comamonadaceae bacterium M7527]